MSMGMPACSLIERAASSDSQAHQRTTARSVEEKPSTSKGRQEPCLEYLIPADGSAFDSFGRSVAISGDVIVVGARGDDENGSSSGSTYVFVDNNGQWVEAAKLLAEGGEASDGFGKAVDVDGDFVVIGAEGADNDQDPALDNIGAAYVFERVGFIVSGRKSVIFSQQVETRTMHLEAVSLQMMARW